MERCWASPGVVQMEANHMFDCVNARMANLLLDALLPFFSAQYLLVPSLVVLTMLFYLGNQPFRRHLILCILPSLIVAGLVSHMAGHVTDSSPPFASGTGRAFVNNTWNLLHSGGQIPVPVEPLRPFPYGTCLAAVFLFGFAGPWRWTLWPLIPLNLCALLAPVYCGWCWPGAALAAWIIGAASFFAVQRLAGGGDVAERGPSVPFLRDLPRERRIFALILTGWTVLSVVGLYYLDYTHYDMEVEEGQFWYWARRLQLGYYSKGPVIALIDWFLSGVLGETASAMRTGSVRLYAATLLPVYGLTKRITGKEQAALTAVVLLAAMPQFTNWAASMNTSAPAYLLWASVLYTSHRAFHGERHMWIWTGLLLGLGLLTRYSFPVLAIALALIVAVFFRGRLRERGPYVAFLCALACILGLLYWQYQHNWITLEDIGREGRTASDPEGGVVEFLKYQLMLVSPVLFLMFLFSSCVMAVKSLKNPDAGMLMLAFMVPFVLCLVLSVTRDVGAHWPQCAYLAAAPAAGWVIAESRRRRLMRTLVLAGITAGLAEGIPGYVLWPCSTSVMVGMQEVAQRAQQYCRATDANAPFLFTHAYPAAALLSFYTPGHPDIPCCGDSIECHDLCEWTDWGALAGRDAICILLLHDRAKAQDAIDQLVSKGAFTGGEYLETIRIERWGMPHFFRTVSLIRLHGFSGQDMCGLYLTRGEILLGGP